MIETPIIPRVSETDGAGHINNTVIPIWFEGGRTEIFRVLTPDLDFKNWRVALVNMNIDYLAQTYFQDPAVVRTWVDKVGTKSFTLYEELWQGARLCAKGTATYVYFNYDDQEAKPVPENVRVALLTHSRNGDEAIE
ncbi:MAG: thioesterase family protein [Pseudomonadota bacterium]|nr:thioesterase family protein [Pseudomonadota bacterium]MEC8163635.1 thioesterase family protein [Pseudomonadota bacterium]MEC8197936.1 thioesterase family protein [Pseudomonadota bacterium]MEC8699679.1 thioesterase family protein [Pseudomonadota bacterium]MED5575135.1 thioesterase family protein [Pseudomonadota bacterium]|tara:strand:- start:326 stop:736 length:411 start_codon:yes stop_codon:yes gene_type:complete